MTRKVVTRAGTDFYQVSLGSILTPEIVAAAKLRSGGKPAPRGSTATARLASRVPATRVPDVSVRQTPPEAPVALSAGAAVDPSHRPASVTPSGKVETIEPEVFGSKRILVAGVGWGVPSNSKIAQMKNAMGVYVLTSGSLYVLLRQAGRVRQVVMSGPMQEALTEKLLREYEFQS